MKVLIENYRGWEIYFNTDGEDFYTTSNEHDTQQSKRSYAATKKFIDDFIKENTEFRPFKIECMPSLYKNRDVKTIVGIRKDGALVYRDKDGSKRQFRTHNEKEYFLVDPENEAIFKQIDEIEQLISAHSKEMKELEKMVKKVTVQELKSKYIQQ
jgi:hypothetical protein